MKNNLKVILLICAAIVIFILGVIFGFFVSPNRYKIESNGRIKLDTITGRVWIYNSERDVFVERGKGKKPTFGQNDEIVSAIPPPAGFTEEVNIATIPPKRGEGKKSTYDLTDLGGVIVAEPNKQ